MAVTLLLSTWILMYYFVGATAEICEGDFSAINCIFGCCAENDVLDNYYVYCCLSNGAGIAIISASVAVILSMMAYFCRRAHLYNDRRTPALMSNHGVPTVSVVSTLADQYAYNNTQMTDKSAPPPYPGPAMTSSSAATHTSTSNDSFKQCDSTDR